MLLPAVLPLLITACNKDDNGGIKTEQRTLVISNILDAKPLVQSGTFQGTGTPPVILPGESVSFRFSAAVGQAVTFATMYGFSNDLFFAPANPGILLYDENGQPVEGDVSDQLKLWDNGTRVNQVPGPAVDHPGVAESNPIAKVGDTDAQGNTYLPASSLVKATLTYDGDSYFSLTLTNMSGGTGNETPLSPGVWAVSYIAGGNFLHPSPIYAEGQSTANGLTALAETGDNATLYEYLANNTGIFTPLSPVLAVVYNGIDNPLVEVGETDAGIGLKELAQQGDASILAAALESMAGVKKVYVLPASNTTVLLPMIGGAPGGSVSQQLEVIEGDRLAIATMYGFSNDWFFATAGEGIDPTQPGDVSGAVKLYDNGTAVDQYPGAGNNQVNLGGSTVKESQTIEEVPNPNAFNTLPEVADIIRVSIQ